MQLAVVAQRFTELTQLRGAKISSELWVESDETTMEIPICQSHITRLAQLDSSQTLHSVAPLKR